MWAYPELKWRPLPVFQNQLVLSRALDQVNADALSGTNGPERILRAKPTIVTQAPETTLALLCGYRHLRAAGNWQVLARAPTSRCGEARELERVRVRTIGPCASRHHAPTKSSSLALRASNRRSRIVW